jgi:hypothetical protein
MADTPPKIITGEFFSKLRLCWRMGVLAMSIADRFDHGSDAGFVRAYDAQAARRQFQISIVLVAVLALAAVVLGLLVRLDRPSVPERSSAIIMSSPHLAETLLDIRG